jgi:hypothetical protein
MEAANKDIKKRNEKIKDDDKYTDKDSSDVVTLVKGIDALSEEDKKARNVYLRSLAIGNIEGPPVGFPSIDMPWLADYQEEEITSDIKYRRMYEEVKENCEKYSQHIAIEYFGNKITYKELLENGSITEIKKAMNKDIDFFRFRIDEQKDTILMYAIEKKRPLEIIQLLYKSGTRTYWKNKNKQSALSYVCKYSDDDDVIKFILEKSGSKNTTKRRLLQKDIEGLSPYDYAKQNPYTSIMQLIEPYFTEAEFDASVVKMPSAKATYVQETKPEPQKPVVVQKPENPPVPTEEKKVEPKEVEPKVEKKVESVPAVEEVTVEEVAVAVAVEEAAEQVSAVTDEPVKPKRGRKPKVKNEE